MIKTCSLDPKIEAGGLFNPMHNIKDGSLNFYRVFNQKAAKLLYGHTITEQIHVADTSDLTEQRRSLVFWSCKAEKPIPAVVL